jgi:hypothetical protein
MTDALEAYIDVVRPSLRCAPSANRSVTNPSVADISNTSCTTPDRATANPPIATALLLHNSCMQTESWSHK